jgi:formate hydrogenlyase subunit 3/multisubunit Na+/H+ antiporter MnhD subunit
VTPDAAGATNLGLAVGAILPVFAPLLAFLAAVFSLFRRARTFAAPLLFVAIAAEVALGLASTGLNAALGTDQQPLFAWSPLGLYGVTLVLGRSAEVAILSVPCLGLALAALLLTERRRRWFSALGDASLRDRASVTFALVAIVGALIAIRAADFLSLFLGLSSFLLAGAGLLALCAGPAIAGRRVLVAYATTVVGLGTVLTLGRVNGHFELGNLSGSGFTGGPFLGIAMAAAVCGALPPFHGWLLRISRHSMAPALAAAGSSVALTLLFITIRTVDLAALWQAELRLAGWIAILIGASIALTRRAPAIRLAAASVTRAGALFLAASVSTPAALGATLLYTLVMEVSLGLLWLSASVPWGGQRRASRATVSLPIRSPGFWLLVLVIATAAALPPTLGGVARSALTGSLTAWPAGDQTLRGALFIADAVTLTAGAALLWDERFLPPLRGWLGWVIVAFSGLLLVGPTASPARLIGGWLGPAAAEAGGTFGSPLALQAARIPTLPSITLAIIAAWILIQRIRRREWLPPLGHALMGALALGWLELSRRIHNRGVSRAPSRMVQRTWEALQSGADRAMLLLRPVEERYYAGAAVLVAVAVIYIVGRQ